MSKWWQALKDSVAPGSQVQEVHTRDNLLNNLRVYLTQYSWAVADKDVRVQVVDDSAMVNGATACMAMH